MNTKQGEVEMHEHEPADHIVAFWHQCMHCGCQIEPQWCPRCDGTGNQSENFDCKWCKGTGVERWVEGKP